MYYLSKLPSPDELEPSKTLMVGRGPGMSLAGERVSLV